MVSEAQKRTTAKYQKEKVKSITVRFYPSDMRLFDWFKSQHNQAGYIKDLIRQDMERR